ncbi:MULTISPECIES: transposase [Sphingomonadales]|nr:transposase [Sphingobium indicum]
MGHEEKYLLIGNVVARHRKPIARCSMSVPIPPPATAPICPPKEGEKDRHRLSGPLSGRGCAPPYDQTRQPILPAIIVAAQPAIVVVAAQVEPKWAGRMTPEDYRGLTPLIYSHVNPYGRFDLDLNDRIDFGRLAA